MYDTIANSLEAYVPTLNSCITKIKSNSLETSWTGDTSTSLNTELDESVAALETQRNNLVNFIATLRNVEQYKSNKERVSSLQSTLSSIADTEENAQARSSIILEISNLEGVNETLRTSITTALEGFTEYSSSKTLVTIAV